MKFIVKICQVEVLTRLLTSFNLSNFRGILAGCFLYSSDQKLYYLPKTTFLKDTLLRRDISFKVNPFHWAGIFHFC